MTFKSDKQRKAVMSKLRHMYNMGGDGKKIKILSRNDDGSINYKTSDGHFGRKVSFSTFKEMMQDEI